MSIFLWIWVKYFVDNFIPVIHQTYQSCCDLLKHGNCNTVLIKAVVSGQLSLRQSHIVGHPMSFRIHTLTPNKSALIWKYSSKADLTLREMKPCAFYRQRTKPLLFTWSSFFMRAKTRNRKWDEAKSVSKFRNNTLELITCQDITEMSVRGRVSKSLEASQDYMV